MKYAVGPEAYALMLADSIDSITATQVAQYADFYFEYDSPRRATLERVGDKRESSDKSEHSKVLRRLGQAGLDLETGRISTKHATNQRIASAVIGLRRPNIRPLPTMQEKAPTSRSTPKSCVGWVQRALIWKQVASV